jgi:hypothetical protein
MMTVMLDIEYKIYSDFLVSFRSLGFCAVTRIDEGLVVSHLLKLESRSVLELNVSITLVNLYCLLEGSWNLESVFEPRGNVE